MKSVTIIDYGMSNLLSICRAFEYLGAQVKIIQSPEKILGSDYLVLPGVGAFPDGMKALNDRNFPSAISAFAETGKPLLGICLGMQMLLTRGMEHSVTDGLNLIEGEVLPLPRSVPGFKVPNINWHSVSEPSPEKWKNTIFQGISNDSYFYFVHSFYAKPIHDESILGQTKFGELVFASAIKKSNIMGTQFHPEKSGVNGLNLLSAFLKL